MVDSARAERLLHAYLRKPAGPRPSEPLPGLTAAAVLALLSAWPGAAELRLAQEGGRRGWEARVEELLRTAAGSIAAGRASTTKLPGTFRVPRRLLDAAASAEDADLPGLARDLACRGGEEARLLLALFAYGLQRDRGPVLGHAADEGIRLLLADAGCGHEDIAEARSGFFPGYRDPYALLDLEPGADAEALRHAWRLKSLAVHPDALAAGAADAAGGAAGAAAGAATGDDSAEFRALREAYDYLRGRGTGPLSEEGAPR
jgi:hypothetical protein